MNPKVKKKVPVLELDLVVRLTGDTGATTSDNASLVDTAVGDGTCVAAACFVRLLVFIFTFGTFQEL